MDITTTPEAGVADLRVLSGTGSFDVSRMNGEVVTIQRLTVEQSPSQPNGGGFNSTVAANTVALGAPLIANNSINVEFLLGVMRNGNFRFLINVESLHGSTPSSANQPNLKARGAKAAGSRRAK